MKTVLIVDDVAFVRKTLSDIFTKARYQVVGEAANGEEAIAEYKKHRPDLVTMDVVMPKVSGIEATRRIVKMDNEAKILIISAMGQEHLIMEAINAGARDYVLKPFTIQDVLKACEHVLSEPIRTPTSQSTKGGEVSK